MVETIQPQFGAADIKKVWSAREDRDGYGSGDNIADALVGASMITAYEQPDARRFIDHFPTKEFVYDGAQDTVTNLMRSGNNVLIWTQGEPRHQIYKVASSGMLSLRRDQDIPQAKERLHAYAHMDKVADLENVIGDEHMKGNVVIVDDKSKNVIKAHKKIEQLRSEGKIADGRSIEVVWINQGRTKDQVPTDFTVEDFKQKYRTIEDIRELNGAYDGAEDTTFLLDWDHTLCNTSAWRTDSQAQIADRLSRAPIVGHFIDEKVGLEQYGDKKTFSNGMSGAGVASATHQTTGERMVVKYRRDNRPDLEREIQGRRLLMDTPLESHLLPLDTSHAHRGVLLTPHFEGTQLREGVKSGVVDSGLITQIFDELIDLKQSWWSEQQPQGQDEIYSMQRTEWNDTIKHVTEDVIPQLAASLKISVDRLTSMNLHHNGIELPSLAETLAALHGFYTNKNRVPYTVLAHNDATGANIVVDPDTREWKLFDYEWAGPNDPAESYARMIKWVTQSTIPTTTADARLSQHHNAVELDISCALPPMAAKLQQRGIERGKEVEDSLRDPEFFERMQLYLAGSYMREAALSHKRGGREAAIFGVLNASSVLSRFEVYP